MATPLTLYGSANPATTITTAADMWAATGGASANIATKIARLNQTWIEIAAVGVPSGTPVGQSTQGGPSGAGWLYDTSALDGASFAAGTWTPSFSLLCNKAGITVTPVLRLYKVSGGGTPTYTLLGSVTGSSKSLATTASALTFPTWSVGAVSLGIGEQLYVDLWVNITSNTAASNTETISVVEASATSTAGVANQAQLVTPGYTTQNVITTLWTSNAESASAATEGVTFNTASGGTLEFLGGSSAHTGSYGYHLAGATNAQFPEFVRSQATTLGRHYYLRTYFFAPSAPAGGHIEMISPRSASAAIGTVIWDQNGTLSWYNGITAVQSATYACAPGSWHRVDFHLMVPASGTGTVELRIDGTTQYTNTAENVGTAALSEIRFGCDWGNATSWDISFDDLALNESLTADPTAWPADVTGSPSTTYTVAAGAALALQTTQNTRTAGAALALQAQGVARTAQAAVALKTSGNSRTAGATIALKVAGVTRIAGATLALAGGTTSTVAAGAAVAVKASGVARTASAAIALKQTGLSRNAGAQIAVKAAGLTRQARAQVALKTAGTVRVAGARFALKTSGSSRSAAAGIALKSTGNTQAAGATIALVGGSRFTRTAGASIALRKTGAIQSAGAALALQRTGLTRQSSAQVALAQQHARTAQAAVALVAGGSAAAHASMALTATTRRMARATLALQTVGTTVTARGQIAVLAAGLMRSAGATLALREAPQAGQFSPSATASLDSIGPATLEATLLPDPASATTVAFAPDPAATTAAAFRTTEEPTATSAQFLNDGPTTTAAGVSD